jgi:DNA-binding protein YbaB
MTTNSRPLSGPDPGEISETLERYLKSATESIESSVDGLVRVRVTPTLTVESVEFLDVKLDRDTKHALETATAGAINTALQRVMFQAGRVVTEMGQQASKRGGDQS